MISFIFLISWISGPAQRPGIDKVHGTAIPCSRSGVSLCKVVVVTMGTIATAVAIAEGDGPRISCKNHGQSSEDGGYGQNVQNLFPRKGLVYQFWAALGNPRFWPSKGGPCFFVSTYYYILLRINTYQKAPALFHSRRRRRHTRCQLHLPGRLFWRIWWKEVSNGHTRHCQGSAQSVPPLAGVWRQSLLDYIHGTSF